MNIRFILLLVLIVMMGASTCFGQDYQIKTLFSKNPGHRATGAYGAISNKFTSIDGHYANMVEVYGGVYINHKFLIGLSGAAVTNDIPVPEQFSSVPGVKMSYEYGQVGMMLEYVFWSNRAFHFSLHSFNGAGFTVQYERHREADNTYDNMKDQPDDSNWFFVTEPGVKVEMNVFRWMRFSPGVSYRAAFNSKAAGLSDEALSGTSLNLTLKFGKF
jgi:hypothetical protein